MKAFMDENFILSNETAQRLYHEYAADMPIFDYHNHLSAKEIYEDKQFGNISEVWLGGDHYKWRAMRTLGIPEEIVTGENNYEKFLAWAKTVPYTIGNPLYHWTHMELQRYFGITDTLSPKTAEKIWNICNEKLASKEFTARNLLKMQNVKILCTTEDPTDDLEYHKKLHDEGFEIKVLPAFRPDKALNIEKNTYKDYIDLLAEKTGKELSCLDALLDALTERLDYFTENGCIATDHSLEFNIYKKASHDEVDAVYKKKLAGEALTGDECAMYRGYVLTFLGKNYAKRGLAMELHFGCMRDNSSRYSKLLGPDTGFDSMSDIHYSFELSALLDEMDKTDELPKTILFCLNPNDSEMLASMLGNFQEGGIKGKMQFGTAWWLNDHKPGMERQMEALSTIGLLSTFLGMLTDSRSFLSFPRHEYFRRILCNKIGCWVENGEYPCDMEILGEIVKDISYNNAYNYFNCGK